MVHGLHHKGTWKGMESGVHKSLFCRTISAITVPKYMSVTCFIIILKIQGKYEKLNIVILRVNEQGNEVIFF
jgi:hypothetical protein